MDSIYTYVFFCRAVVDSSLWQPLFELAQFIFQTNPLRLRSRYYRRRKAKSFPFSALYLYILILVRFYEDTSVDIPVWL